MLALIIPMEGDVLVKSDCHAHITPSDRTRGTNHRHLNKNVARSNSLFPSNENWGSRTEKKTVVSCHGVCQNYTGASKCIVPLKFFLNMSSVRWQLNGRTKQDCLLCQDSEAPEAWYQPLWRLAQFWQSANISQVFRIGVCTYLTLLVDRFFLA